MRRTPWWVLVPAAVVLLAAACGLRQRADTKAPEDGPSLAALPTAAALNEGDRLKRDALAGASPPAAAQGQSQAGAPAADRQPSGAPVSGLDRKLVYTVFLDLTVQDVQTGFERIAAIAEASGGLVAESNLRQDGDQRRATITIRVPAVRYQDVLGQIRGLATRVESERLTANDVTEEYTDLQSRLRNLEATEQQLLGFLAQAKTIQEVLQVQDRLNSTRAEIERVKGRINLLTRLSDLATIQIQLRPESAPATTAPRPNDPLAALRRGWDASITLIGGAALALLTVLAFSWWLLPVAALALWLGRRGLRRRAATPPLPPPAQAAQ